jgi:hypothetical protein
LDRPDHPRAVPAAEVFAVEDYLKSDIGCSVGNRHGAESDATLARGDYKTSLAFARKVNMPAFWRTQLAIAASAGQLGERATAEEALHTLLIQRPDIAKLPRQELEVWWQPDLVEDLIVGLRKAGLAPDRRLLSTL